VADYSFELPLDSDGYLRRQCESCGREFKWHYGTTDLTPPDWIDPDQYFCPLCGQPGDQWATEAQVQYGFDVSMPAAMDDIFADLGKALGPNFKMTRGSGEPVPAFLHEPDDMDAIASPCHPWEPVKVPEDSSAPYHCLVCGTAFVV
jgi:hypothetical protein